MRIILFILTTFVIGACARKAMPKPPTGRAYIEPATEPALALKKKTNVVIRLSVQSNPPEDSLEIQILGKGDSILFDGTWAELKEKTNSESCSSLYSMVDDFDGFTALSCDNEIDFTGMTSARATNSQGQTFTDTGSGVVQVYEDVAKVNISF